MAEEKTPVLEKRCNEIECCGRKLTGWEEVGGHSYKILRTTCEDCKTFYGVKRNVGVVYVEKPGKKTRCLDCGSEIRRKRVSHSNHIKGTLMRGGDNIEEDVPYCPKCESEPSGGFIET